MTPCGAGDALDVEGSGRDIVVRIEAAAIGVFGPCVEQEESLDGLEARLARIASLGCYPVDFAGGGVGARLDPAMPLLDGGFGDEFGGGSGAEIVLDIGFECRLVAFEGEQVIGLIRDDLVGDLDLAAHSVDGDECAFELAGFGELIEKIGDGGDLVGLLGNAGLRQRQAGGGSVGAERVQGLETLAVVMGAARRLAIDGDEIVPPRPKRRDPALKTTPKEDRIDPIDEAAQPALTRNAMMEVGELSQKRQVM